MVHLGVSWTHFNYIDSNGTLNDSYHHGMLICSSLKETTFWTMILAIAGGWRVTPDRVSTTQKSTIYTAMLLLFLCNILVQMDLGIRTVYFVYNLVYCSIISMTIFWSSKTIQTLAQQYEIFRQSGATAEDLARVPVKAKEGMYHTFYVVFVTFSGFKVLNQILYAYYRRDSAWVHSFLLGVPRLGGMVFPPRSLQAKRSNVLDVFPGKRVRSFWIRRLNPSRADGCSTARHHASSGHLRCRGFGRVKNPS